MKSGLKPFFGPSFQTHDLYTAADFRRPFFTHKNSRRKSPIYRAFKIATGILSLYATYLTQWQVPRNLHDTVEDTLLRGCPLATLEGKPLLKLAPIPVEASVSPTKDGGIKVDAIIPYPAREFLLKYGPGLAIKSIPFSFDPDPPETPIDRYLRCLEL